MKLHCLPTPVRYHRSRQTLGRRSIGPMAGLSLRGSTPSEPVLKRHRAPGLTGKVVRLVVEQPEQPAVMFSRGLGGVINLNRPEMGELARKGVDLWGHMPHGLSVNGETAWGKLLFRQAMEILGFRHFYAQKIRLFQHFFEHPDTQQKPKGMIFDSFSLRYLLNMANEDHAFFRQVTRIALIAPALDSSTQLRWIDRQLHGLGPRQIMKSSRDLWPALDKMVDQYQIPLLMLVPLDDETVNPERSIVAFKGMKSRSPRTMLTMPRVKHWPFRSLHPQEQRSFLTSLLAEFMHGRAIQGMESHSRSFDFDWIERNT